MKKVFLNKKETGMPSKIEGPSQIKIWGGKASQQAPKKYHIHLISSLEKTITD